MPSSNYSQRSNPRLKPRFPRLQLQKRRRLLDDQQWPVGFRITHDRDGINVIALRR